MLGLANLDLELGRYQEGLEALRRLAELAATKRDLYYEANARYDMARAVLDQTGELPSEEGRQEAARLAQQALDTAVAGRNGSVLANIHVMLGILSKGEAARHHFAACLAAATKARDQSSCLDGEARFLSTTDPAAAQRAIDRSLAVARQAQDAWSMAFAWREQMRLLRGERQGRSRSALAALDTIEAMRDQQAGSAGQAEAFSTWSEDYYWLSGRLIAAALPRKHPEDLEQAFEVAERLRARSSPTPSNRPTRYPPPRSRSGSGEAPCSSRSRPCRAACSIPPCRRPSAPPPAAISTAWRSRRPTCAISSPARRRPSPPPAVPTSPPWRGCGRRSPPTRRCCRSRSPRGRTSGAISPAAPGCW